MTTGVVAARAGEMLPGKVADRGQGILVGSADRVSILAAIHSASDPDPSSTFSAWRAWPPPLSLSLPEEEEENFRPLLGRSSSDEELVSEPGGGMSPRLPAT